MKKKWASFSRTGTTTKRLRTSTGNVAFEVQDLALALVYYSVRSQSEQYSPKQCSRAMVARSSCSIQPADCLYSARWGLAKATVHLCFLQHDQQDKNGREEEEYWREIAQLLLHGRFDLGEASEEDQLSLTKGLRAACTNSNMLDFLETGDAYLPHIMGLPPHKLQHRANRSQRDI